MLFRSGGGVAHLGERLNGIQEVRGSIPLISTNKKNIVWLLLPATIQWIFDSRYSVLRLTRPRGTSPHQL